MKVQPAGLMMNLKKKIMMILKKMISVENSIPGGLVLEINIGLQQ